MTAGHAQGDDAHGTEQDADTAEKPDAAASGFDPATLRFSTGRVSPAERAAVTVVIGSLLEQESAQRGRTPGDGVTAWQRSQRPLRGTITPGPGRWAQSGA